jgi:hypothetical protein
MNQHPQHTVYKLSVPRKNSRLTTPHSTLLLISTKSSEKDMVKNAKSRHSIRLLSHREAQLRIKIKWQLKRRRCTYKSPEIPCEEVEIRAGEWEYGREQAHVHQMHLQRRRPDQLGPFVGGNAEDGGLASR